MASKDANKKYYEQNKAQLNADRKSKRDDLKQNQTDQADKLKDMENKLNQFQKDIQQNKQVVDQSQQIKIAQKEIGDQTPEKIKQIVKTIQTDTIPVLPIDPEAHYVKMIEPYLQRNGEFEDFEDHKEIEKGLIISGESGLGKTQCVTAYADQNNYPLIKVTCSEGVKDTKLLGTWNLINGNSCYCLGAIPTAIQVANQTQSKTCVLLFDEINTLDNHTQKILNENLNFRQGVFIPALNKTFTLNEDSKILIVATQNPSYFLGTNELNYEIPSRFNIRHWEDLTEEQTQELLSKYEMDKELIGRLTRLKTQIKAGYDSGNLDYPIDTREIVKFCLFYKQVNKRMKKTDDTIKHCLELVFVGKYQAKSKEQYKLVTEMIESIFGLGS
jgi:AAA+ superfamily predicted ATPase